MWESNTHLKIHEGCGGLVRWVEAYDDPHTGFTGECLECGEQRIVVERIIPIEVPPGEIGIELFNRSDIGDLRALTWDQSDDYRENQRRLADELGIRGETV